MKTTQTTDILDRWKALNKYLANVTSESVCESLLKQEQRQRGRVSYMLRIHSRLNKLRADRERAALAAGYKWPLVQTRRL